LAESFKAGRSTAANLNLHFFFFFPRREKIFESSELTGGASERGKGETR